MTLVPAVLTLLGTKAWWLPRWIDRRLPSFDVEGEGLAHQVALAEWPAPDDRHLVVAEGLRVGDFDDVAPSVLPGEVLVVEGPTAVEATALLLAQHGLQQGGDQRVRRQGPQHAVGEPGGSPGLAVGAAEEADRLAGEAADRVLVAVEQQLREVVP